MELLLDFSRGAESWQGGQEETSTGLAGWSDVGQWRQHPVGLGHPSSLLLGSRHNRDSYLRPTDIRGLLPVAYGVLALLSDVALGRNWATDTHELL